MTVDTFSATGLTYEQRCQEAADVLRSARANIDAILEVDLRSLQEIHVVNEERRKNLSPVALELLDKFSQKRENAFRDSSQKMAEIVHGHAVALCTSLFGADATAIALEIIKREVPGN